MAAPNLVSGQDYLHQVRTFEEIRELFVNNQTRTLAQGIAIPSSPGGILFEDSCTEPHAAIPIPAPDRLNPTKLGFVWYTHE